MEIFREVHNEEGSLSVVEKIKIVDKPENNSKI
jgi:hypothetical protein